MIGYLFQVSCRPSSNKVLGVEEMLMNGYLGVSSAVQELIRPGLPER